MQNLIYVQIDEDISSILQRIDHFKNSTIRLVIPKKSILFQSSVNLGILKHRSEEKGNLLILVTQDRIGKNLAKNAGVKVQSNLIKKTLGKKAAKKLADDPVPIKARRNQIRLDKPRRIQQKFTIGQLVQNLRETKQEEKDSFLDRFYNSVNYSRPVMLTLLLILSVVMFFLISYIALPGATILVRPSFETLNHSVNVVLVDRNDGFLENEPNIIPAQVIESTAKETRIFNTTGKRFDGTNAKGTITVINTAREEWQLIEQTRFQSPEGLIFRTQNWITVPAATVNSAGETVPGTLDVTVIADEFDPFNKPIGDRGNIEPTTFTIPALSAYNQDRIWGESKSAFSGGVSAYSVRVNQDDIDSAQTDLQENLIEIAKAELQSHLEDLNKLNQTNLELLNEDRYINTNLIETRLPEGLEGSDKEKFEVYAEVAVEGIAYDGEALFTFLKKELEKRAHPDMMVKVDSIDPERIQYEFVDTQRGLDQMKEDGEIKLTVTVDGLQEYVIDSSLEAGLRFSNQVKEEVVNLPLEEAQAYVNNLPEVEEVEIKMWPVWLKKMPRLEEKIEVKLLE